MKIFGFDFSIAKPAMCYFNTDTREMKLYCWPMDLDERSVKILEATDVIVKNRGLSPLSKKEFTSNQFVLENTKRAYDLAQMIASDIKELIGNTPLSEVVVCSEGLSYNSLGNRTLDLSGYKYTLLTTIYGIGVEKIFTYSPLSIKGIAGCVKKGMWTKDFMINAIKTTDTSMHKFIYTLANEEQNLKKTSAFVKCVDDLVDAYWATRTYLEKELNNHSLH